MNQQTIIPANTDGEAGFENFFGTDNQNLVHELRNLIAGRRNRRIIYFWGETASGKTHLLHGCCREASLTGRPYCYMIPDPDSWGIAVEVKSNSVVCVDDFQLIAGQSSLQQDLFALYEKLVAQGSGVMVVAANISLTGLNIELKDLQSRLSSGGIFRVSAMDDQSKRAALGERAARRGIDLKSNVIDFIMSHYKRDTASLFALFEKLDTASMQSHRRITIPFVKTLIEDQEPRD